VLLIRNIKLFKGKYLTRANILISEDGKIVKIYRSMYTNHYFFSRINEIYNGKERLALPGIIDLHVHFREPGFEYKEDFETGSKAAIAGGTTIVADMPNNNPRIKTLEDLLMKLRKIKNRSYVDYLLYLEVPDKMEEYDKIIRSDIKPAGIKVYFYLTNEENAFLKGNISPHFLYIIHAEDSRYIKSSYECHSYKSFALSRPNIAEKNAVIKALEMARKGVTIHFTHISTLDAVLEIQKAKKMGLPITADVTPHHLLLTIEDGEKLGSVAKCYPPLRTELDRRFLINAIEGGIIDAIATDHAPHAPKEKRMDLCRSSAGIASVQYTFSLIFTLLRKYRISDPRPFLKALSENPAKILGLEDRGKIAVGYYADIVIFNYKKKWRIWDEDGYSKAKCTPWNGMMVYGLVEATFLRGKLVYEEGEFLKKIGCFLQPKFKK